MDDAERIVNLREWVVELACAIYNGEDWDKQQVAAFLHMGEPGLDYTFRDEPPTTISREDVLAAIDRIFERHNATEGQ